MGAVFAVPVIGTIVAFALTPWDVMYTVAFISTEAVAIAGMTTAIAFEVDGTWALFFAHLNEAAHWYGWKRDGAYGTKGKLPIKFLFDPADPAHRYPMSISTFNITTMDRSTGVAQWVWSNTTDLQNHGGSMTGMWLNDDDTLKFPPWNEPTTGDYDWYPNGTITVATDASGVPIVGNWTTKLNEHDKAFFGNLTNKNAAMIRERELNNADRPKFCMHVKEGKSGPGWFSGEDSCRLRNHTSKRNVDLRRRAEEDVGYEGDSVLLAALATAFKGNKRTM